MREYIVSVWFAGRCSVPDAAMVIQTTRFLDVNNVAEGALRVLGEWCAPCVVVTDVAGGNHTTTLTDVVLDV